MESSIQIRDPELRSIIDDYVYDLVSYCPSFTSIIDSYIFSTEDAHYLATGQLAESCQTKYNIRHGTCRSWYFGGHTRCVCSYQDGKLHGDYTRWFEDGRVHLETSYRHGLEHGDCTQWFSNG
jgi:antitoxin component YwqK of YwqJK toxin-antitoxin module